MTKMGKDYYLGFKNETSFSGKSEAEENYLPFDFGKKTEKDRTINMVDKQHLVQPIVLPPKSELVKIEKMGILMRVKVFLRRLFHRKTKYESEIDYANRTWVKKEPKNENREKIIFNGTGLLGFQPADMNHPYPRVDVKQNPVGKIIQYRSGQFYNLDTFEVSDQPIHDMDHHYQITQFTFTEHMKMEGYIEDFAYNLGDFVKHIKEGHWKKVVNGEKPDGFIVKQLKEGLEDICVIQKCNFNIIPSNVFDNHSTIRIPQFSEPSWKLRSEMQMKPEVKIESYHILTRKKYPEIPDEVFKQAISEPLPIRSSSVEDTEPIIEKKEVPFSDVLDKAFKDWENKEKGSKKL